MPEVKVVGRVPPYANGENARESEETREISLQISDDDGVLIVDLALSSEDNAVQEEDAHRLWIHWQKGIGWTIEIHKDELAPFARVRINDDLTTTTTIVRGFDNAIVDSRKLNEK